MKNIDRAIVYLESPDFFIECERLANSSLKGKPLILGGERDRGYVHSCSLEAKRFGVRRSMPISLALRLCPEARVLKGDKELYSNKSKELTEILRAKAPVVEQESIHCYFLDITGMDRFYGCFEWTDEMVLNLVKESGIFPQWALSINKTVSKIAGLQASPFKPININTEGVTQFLNPLPIQRLPQVGARTYQLFSRIGIRSIGKIAEMPSVVVEKMVGPKGKTLWQRANGIDREPVSRFQEKLEMSEEHRFEHDSIDIHAIHGVLGAMAERLGFRLRKSRLLTSRISVIVKYNNLDTESKQLKVLLTSLDHVLKKHVLSLFSKLYHRRMRLLRITVKVGNLVPGSHQIDLFIDTKEQLALYSAMDRIREKYGVSSIGTGGTLENHRF